MTTGFGSTPDAQGRTSVMIHFQRLPGRIRNMVSAVCAVRGVDPIRVLSVQQNAPLVAARREIAERLQAEGHSLPEIGRHLRRDHSTIINLLKPKKSFAAFEAARAKPRPFEPDFSGEWAI